MRLVAKFNIKMDRWNSNPVCGMVFIYFGIYSVNLVSSSVIGDSKNVKEALSHYSNLVENVVENIELLEKLSSIDVSKIRVKRQSGGKYEDAATMDQMKLFRLFIMLFKNMFSGTYVGGAHPLHHRVPKPFVQFYRELIVDKFLKDQHDEEAE